MHAGIERAPEPPALLALEFVERHRQVMLGIPAIETLPQRRFDDGPDGNTLWAWCGPCRATVKQRMLANAIPPRDSGEGDHALARWEASIYTKISRRKRIIASDAPSTILRCYAAPDGPPPPLGGGGCEFHSPLIPAALMIGHHLSISAV